MWKRLDSNSVSVLIGILVSSVISVGVAVILILSGEETIPAVMIALLIMIITILLDILLRVRFSETLLGELLNLYEDPWLFKTIKNIIRGHREIIHRSKNEIILNHARDILEVTARELAELSNGHMMTGTPIAEREFLIKIMRFAKKEVKAVAHAEWFGTWWEGPMAKNYMEENRVQPDLRGLTGKIAVVPANQAKFGEREWKPFGYHNNGA